MKNEEKDELEDGPSKSEVTCCSINGFEMGIRCVATRKFHIFMISYEPRYVCKSYSVDSETAQEGDPTARQH